MSLEDQPHTPADPLGGGATLVALLLSTPPAWLVSPLPWGIYVTAYVVLVQSGAARFLASKLPALPLSLALSLADGLLRGVAIASMPAAASVTSNSSWITPVILGVIATCAGPWIAQAVGMNKAQWAVGVPPVLNGGLLNTLEVWGAAAAGVLYVALTQPYPALLPVRKLVTTWLPAEYLAEAEGTPNLGGLVTSDIARALVVLVLVGLFAARAITEFAVSQRAARTTSPTTATTAKHKVRASITPAPAPRKQALEKVEAASIAETPASPSEGASGSSKPRKRKAKSKSKSPAL